MRVTEVTVRVAFEQPNPHIRAYASIVLDGCFIIHQIRIVEGHEGRLLVAMPSKRIPGEAPNGRRTLTDSQTRQPYYYADIVHPITQDFRQHLERHVLGAYRYAVVKGIHSTTIPVGGPARGEDLQCVA
jgi:stage V sporulation protein G